MSAAGDLRIEALRLNFGARTVLEEISLQVAAGEIVCLLGPSGSGKSTLLRTIAGIERASAGRILIDGIEVDGPAGFVEPERRRVGLVFQDYALFPHLTVAQNAAFGLARSERAAALPLLERFGLARYAASHPHVLSGGERQRLALARAMAPGPRVLLMDEPFSSLDAQLREDVRRHTAAFLRQSHTTAVIVTHDPQEARAVADRIAVLHAGRIARIGAADAVLPSPVTPAMSARALDATRAITPPTD